MKPKKDPQTKVRAISIAFLILWCMVIAGFLAVSFMSLNCMRIQNCPTEFLDSSEEIGHHFLQIEFGLFFFFFVLYEIFRPVGICQAIKTWSRQTIWVIARLLSPPPRISFS